VKRLARIGLGLLLLVLGGPARAADTPATEASRHFQRAVELYNDGDFRGALVEFKKAYTLLPRASVLYDIGQTEYQIQDYAPALQTLERFLAETGPNAAHRAEVQETVQVLRGRVGKIALTTDRAECEVTLDDQPAGTTPLSQPMLVSVGRRRVAVACAGSQRVAREVEVAAGETVPVELKVGPTAATPVPALVTAPTDTSQKTGRGGTVAAWTITAILAGATAGLYGGAIFESRKLDDLRHSYPISSAALDDKVKLTSRLALAGDILAVATVVSAGVSTYLSLSSHEERGVQIGLTMTGGLTVQGAF
jgi:tetratricopeptide (TPR) repeat protein